MASITLTIPDNKANKVYDAFNRAYKDTTVNPTTSQKVAFVKTQIINYVTTLVYADDINQTLIAAKTGVAQDSVIS